MTKPSQSVSAHKWVHTTVSFKGSVYKTNKKTNKHTGGGICNYRILGKCTSTCRHNAPSLSLYFLQQLHTLKNILLVVLIQYYSLLPSHTVKEHNVHMHDLVTVYTTHGDINVNVNESTNAWFVIIMIDSIAVLIESECTVYMDSALFTLRLHNAKSFDVDVQQQCWALSSLWTGTRTFSVPEESSRRSSFSGSTSSSSQS